MTIALTTPIPHPTDNQAAITTVQISYESQRVMIRVKLLQTGETQDYIVGQGGIDTIGNLLLAVPQFAGLRNALEQYLTTKVGQLGGSVT